jgi:hypothetical protein
MKHLSFFLLLIIFSFKLNAQPSKESVDRFITKNFRIPDSLKTDCNWNYLALELSIDKQNNLEYKIKGYLGTPLLKSLDFLKNYKVTEYEKKNLPALIFMTIKNQTGDCGDQNFYAPYAADITNIITQIISDELKLFPKIRIESMTMVSYPSVY